MKTEAEIKEHLKNWVVTKSKRGPDLQISYQTALLENRIISSLHIMELILEVEKLKGSKFDLKTLKPGAFTNIDSIYTTFFVGAK